MKNMYIGSADVSKLMMKKDTSGFKSLLQRFVSEDTVHYNALASPIDALRTGVIIEDRYFLTLSDDYFPQYKVESEEMNVFVSTIDFAKINNGKIVDFDEVKSIFISDFLELMPLKNISDDEILQFIKKKYKGYYLQVQQQLFTTGLKECNLVFVEVFHYNDEENWIREIQPNEVLKFRIGRDEKIISEIKERGKFFQNIKDYFNKK